VCGIAGLIGPSSVSITPARIQEVLEALGRRGPDASNVCRGDGYTLLHTRLRIIDVSAAADQPMTFPAQSPVVMLFNGEVYNFRALREELTRLGWRFATASDGEVLLAGYHFWGADVFRKARGMWGVAFWHPDEHRLTLSRDPLGKKPLLYVSERSCAFASNLTALLPLLDSTPPIDREALDCYLGHLVVPGEHSILTGVRKVPPGSYVTWHPGGEARTVRYWHLPDADGPGGDTAEVAGEVERLLRTAVRRRLESDVPLGVFLSAGLDSSLVAALAAEESRRRLVAVTAGTTGSGTDERQPASVVVQWYGLDHRCLEVPPASATALPRLIAELGEPFGDSSILPSYEVARAARRDITVALTGDGGDEGFFGYETFQGVYFAERYRRLVPHGVRQLLHVATGSPDATGWHRRLGALCEYGSAPLLQSFRNRMGFGPDERRALLRKDWRAAPHTAEHIYADRLARLRALPDADALRRTFFETFLPNDYLTKVDTATMAASLEARCPFLDIDLVEFVLRLPERQAFGHARRKRLLRPLVRRLLPRALWNRRKSGFTVPVAAWMRGPLRPALDEFVFRPGTLMADILAEAEARRLLVAHERGADHSTRLWGLLALGVWGAVTVERRWSVSDPLPVGPAFLAAT
jgi:asparagine synthase (glutamine-hydrolysing)